MSQYAVVRPNFNVLLRRFTAVAVDFCLPPRCGFCGLSRPHDGICADCLRSLPLIDTGCRRCGSATPAGGTCGRCRPRRDGLRQVVAAAHYAWPLDLAIQRFKFRGAIHYAPAFGTLMRGVAARLDEPVDVVVPMPLHWWRQARRGFNQAELLARAVADELELPVARCARRVRHTRPQSSLPAGERRHNLAGAFRVDGRLPWRHPVIVDDVMTSGHSARELAAALRLAGAASVSLLVLARAGQARL